MQPTYLTVKEFSEQAGVSTQAVYKRIPTDLQKYIKLDGNKKTIDSAALRMFGTQEPEILQPVEINQNAERIEFLELQLTTRDEQISRLLEHIRSQDERLKESTQLATQLQEEKRLLLEEPEPSAPAPEQPAKHRTIRDRFKAFFQ